MGLAASPPDKDLIWDRDQDLSHVITLPAGSYLPATSWALSYSVTHPTTGAALFTAKTVGAGITVTTAGSATVDAVFTVAIADTDTTGATVGIKYNWLLHRTDAGSEVNIDGGTVKFRR